MARRILGPAEAIENLRKKPWLGFANRRGDTTEECEFSRIRSCPARSLIEYTAGERNPLARRSTSFVEPTGISRADSIRAAARRDWRWYLPLWVYLPVVQVLTDAVSGLWSKLPNDASAPLRGTVSVAVAFLFLPVCYLAFVPGLRGWSTQWQSVVLGVITPFALWVVFVFAYGLFR